MSKVINTIRCWLQGHHHTARRDAGVPARDVNIPTVLDTYNQHRPNSAAQLLAGTGIMH